MVTYNTISNIYSAKKTKRFLRPEDKLKIVKDAIRNQHSLMFTDPESREIVRFSPYELRKWESGALFALGIHHEGVKKGKQDSFALSKMWDLHETHSYFNPRKNFKPDRRFDKSAVLLTVCNV